MDIKLKIEDFLNETQDYRKKSSLTRMAKFNDKIERSKIKNEFSILKKILKLCETNIDDLVEMNDLTDIYNLIVKKHPELEN